MKDDKKIQLILGSHAHVPSGAPESEFEFIYENKMRPFVSNLYRYSNIQAVLHYSGILLYWVERNHPEFFMLIEDMVSRKQAEIIGGGFYEPCFLLIPLQDRIGQIELMTTYLRKHFGKRPQGCWLPGMAWEQHLTASLSASDMNYTFLSQDQFIQAGFKDEQLFCPCISEDQGKLITIFPVSLSIEEDLKEKSFSHVFIELNKNMELHSAKTFDNSSAAGSIVCIFPEKVSSSEEEAPDTSWNRFFEEISLSDNIVETTLPGRVIKSNKTYKKGCFPNSSAIKNKTETASIKNACSDYYSPRRFLIEHDEANGIYSKMIFTNVLINQLKGDKCRKQNAREELWKAQDSFLFSPGNGQLRSGLRKAAYSSLLRAERLSRDKGKFISSLIQYDFNFDGVKECLFQDIKINCYIQPKGAGIFEFDYLPKDWNYLDCGSGRFDRRIAFADILAPANFLVNCKNMDNLTDRNDVRLCFNEQYESAAQDRKGRSCFKLSARSNDIPFGGIEINKCYSLKKDILTVSYIIKNTCKDTLKFKFIPEINLSFTCPEDESVRFYTTDANGKDIHLDKTFEADNLKILDVINEVQIVLVSANAFFGCLFHVFNQDYYQATTILPAYSITLEGEKTWTNELSLKFSH